MNMLSYSLFVKQTVSGWLTIRKFSLFAMIYDFWMYTNKTWSSVFCFLSVIWRQLDKSVFLQNKALLHEIKTVKNSTRKNKEKRVGATKGKTMNNPSREGSAFHNIRCQNCYTSWRNIILLYSPLWTRSL